MLRTDVSFCFKNFGFLTLLAISLLVAVEIPCGRVALPEMPSDEGGTPCPLFKIFSDVPVAVC